MARGHREQVPQPHLAQILGNGGRQLVREKIDHMLVDARDQPLLNGDPQECRRETLGARVKHMPGRRRVRITVRLRHHMPVPYDRKTVDADVLPLHLGEQLRDAARIDPLRLRRGARPRLRLHHHRSEARAAHGQPRADSQTPQSQGGGKHERGVRHSP